MQHASKSNLFSDAVVGMSYMCPHAPRRSPSDVGRPTAPTPACLEYGLRLTTRSVLVENYRSSLGFWEIFWTFFRSIFFFDFAMFPVYFVRFLSQIHYHEALIPIAAETLSKKNLNDVFGISFMLPSSIKPQIWTVPTYNQYLPKLLFNLTHKDKIMV